MTDPTHTFSKLPTSLTVTDLEAKIVADIKRVRAICLRGSVVHAYEPGKGFRWGKAGHIAERIGTSPSAIGRALWALKVELLDEFDLRPYWQPATGTLWYLRTEADEDHARLIRLHSEKDRSSDRWEKA